jgi:RNA polymerase sigma factor (sigma-70 family)
MNTSSDSNALLHAYAEHGSESAFAELVRRHVNLVYSAALRRCAGDSALAEEITQTVFTDLARKARSLPREVVIAGWLYRHASFVSATFVRSANRRRQREQTAMELQALQTDADWSRVAPVLEDAMQELSEHDRDALVLRFLDQQPLARVGAALGVSEDAARMRVDRALGKLRDLLARRGVTSTATALAVALGQQGIVAAPASLTATVSASALAMAASTTTSTIGILKLLASTKTKLALGTLVAAGLVVPLVVQHQQADPVYEGHKLSAWLVALNTGADPLHSRAPDALKNIGTNMFPTLIRWIRVKDSPWKQKLRVLINRQSVVKITFTPASEFRSRAVIAFQECGGRAKAAIPALSALLDDSDIVPEVTQALAGIGADSVPVLKEALHHKSAKLLTCASNALALLGADAKSATPDLIALLSDQSPDVRARAVWALANIKSEPAIVLPALANCMNDTDAYVRQNVVSVILAYGEAARSTVPFLLKAINDQEPQVRELARFALRKIDPETAANAGIK